jgi:hypothetical protein
MSIIQTEYNSRNIGLKVSTWGENPLLIYLYNIIDGKKIQVDNYTLPPGHYFEYGRSWFTNWQVEVFEWNKKGKLTQAHTDVFSPYGKKTNFFLAEFDSIETHLEYINACVDYINHWSIPEYNIVTPHAGQIIVNNPHLNVVSSLDDETDCYVSYEIKRTPSAFNSYENYGVYILNEEIVNYNNQHPNPEVGVNDYDLARNILFGPDYKSSLKFIPPTWTLAKK